MAKTSIEWTDSDHKPCRQVPRRSSSRWPDLGRVPRGGAMIETRYVRKRGGHHIWSVTQGPTVDTVLLTLTMANGRTIRQVMLKALLETLYVPVRIDHLGRWVDA